MKIVKNTDNVVLKDNACSNIYSLNSMVELNYTPKCDKN